MTCNLQHLGNTAVTFTQIIDAPVPSPTDLPHLMSSSIPGALFPGNAVVINLADRASTSLDEALHHHGPYQPTHERDEPPQVTFGALHPPDVQLQALVARILPLRPA